MSGHSKWSKIKHIKAATDAKKGKIFSKLAREITIVVKAGGGDPQTNIALRTLIAKGRSANMPADNIDRAIKKGTGELQAEILEEVTYEGFAPGGVGLVVQVVTDNKNRSAAEIRHLFTRNGANMAQQGSVTRGFKRRGQIIVPSDKVGEDRLMELALEAGAEDLVQEDGTFVVSADPATFHGVVEALQKAGVPVASSEIGLIPDVYVPVADKSQASALLKFVDALEDLDDVQNVYTSADIDAKILAEIGGE